MISLDEKPYRGLQIFEWIHNRGVIDFDSMTNLGKDLIGKLNLNSIIKVPEVVNVSTSSEGTKKFLLKLDNDSFIEMVKIPEKKETNPLHLFTSRLCLAMYFLCHWVSWV